MQRPGAQAPGLLFCTPFGSVLASLIDPLTALPNRAMITERLKQLVGQTSATRYSWRSAGGSPK
jgi:hypothetical protein